MLNNLCNYLIFNYLRILKNAQFLKVLEIDPQKQAKKMIFFFIFFNLFSIFSNLAVKTVLNFTNKPTKSIDNHA